jgi:hypothetical protein
MTEKLPSTDNSTGVVDENDVRHDLLPVVLWTDGRRLLFLVYSSEGVDALQRIR